MVPELNNVNVKKKGKSEIPLFLLCLKDLFSAVMVRKSVFLLSSYFFLTVSYPDLIIPVSILSYVIRRSEFGKLVSECSI